MQLYSRIRDLREDADKTQKEIADELFLHLTQYRRYETGEREIPLSLAISISKIYNVSIDYIAGITNNKNGLMKSDLTIEELELISSFKALTPVQQGRILGYMEMFDELNKNNNAAR